MEKLKIMFLGTGDAIPTKKRNHTAILASFRDENILIDCGEGTQRQFKLAKIPATKITRILITHKHGDHTFGLPGLFQTLANYDYSRVLNIYGPQGINYVLSVINELTGKIALKTEVHEVTGKFIEEKDFYILASPMSHHTPTNAYSIVLKDKIRLDKKKLKKFKLPNSPLIGELQRGKDIVYRGKKIKSKAVCYRERGKKITFILDTEFNENAISIAKDSDILIAESSFLDKDSNKAKEYLHMTAKQAAQIAKKAKVKKLILTHISQRYEASLKDIEKEAKKIFKNVFVAKDFDTVEI